MLCVDLRDEHSPEPHAHTHTHQELCAVHFNNLYTLSGEHHNGRTETETARAEALNFLAKDEISLFCVPFQKSKY